MHCCDPLVASFLLSLKFWHLLHSNCTFSVTYQLWSLHYMQITTAASVFIVELRSNTGSWARSIVRSDRPALCERISEFSPQPGSVAVQKIKCHADDPHCHNRNYSQTLFVETPQTHLAEVDSWEPELHHLKGSLKSLFFIIIFDWFCTLFSAKYFFSAL